MSTCHEAEMNAFDRIQNGDALYVFLDPDGSLPQPFLTVVVQKQTGVVYGTQCGGLRCQQRMVEGFLVPVGGKDDDAVLITEDELHAVFHDGSRCLADSWGRTISEDRIDKLQSAVSRIPFWLTPLHHFGERTTLRLDEARVDEVTEAWVPVITGRGPGVLLWTNCD